MGYFLSLNGILSRIQFGFTAGFHFIFVPLTIGLILLIGIMEFLHYKTKKEIYHKMVEFWSDLFIINFAFGVVTGITMSLQFGTNWGNYSKFMGDVFGSPLALEALIAFFLESTFAGVWIFKRNKISPKARLITVWLIVLGTSISAIWIIVANGFMQHPVGYVLAADGSKVILDNFLLLMTNPYTWYMFFHNHASAIVLSAFFIISVSCYHLVYGKKEDRDVYVRSIEIASWALLIGSISLPILGQDYLRYIGIVQPTKIDKIVTGSSAIVRIAFSIMVTLGTLFVLLSLYLVAFKNKFLKSPTIQKIMIYLIPLPYIAILTGWMVTEIGRQPWIVYNLLTVEEGISDVPTAEIIFTLSLITVYYIILGILDYRLTVKRAKEGLKDGGKG